MISETVIAAESRRVTKSWRFAARRKQLQRIARCNLKRIGQARTDNDRIRVVPKIVDVPAGNLLRKISRLEVRRGVDAEEIDRRVIETSSRVEGAAQDRGAGRDIGELPADAHDLGRVRDSIERMAARLIGIVHVLRWNQQAARGGLKTRPQQERSVTSES